ncbi:Ribokinase-like protein [Gloeophyllum trabeum ATCC 11539]|uniref:Ribokinase n=1 Tax=Gloeophyllum trabeum (strain ATCC 11539 / FP-39264 / Madison 617) TaxID=670483 RepID=S7R927_GLOTA|nr:Ribokinase-like protein [Gloeophyllum trabeum ATCC 11539]EPQ50805.1 Ribokinase-like protein [Gloeophyllum trabeum ATCC 11539]
MSRCLVRGSINIDEFFHVRDIVRAGETTSSTGIERRAGGKGANQAVAVARAGGPVELIGAVGEDGRWVRDQLNEFGVNVDEVAFTDEPTGRAVIQLAESGENCIILFKGANYADVPSRTTLHSLGKPISHLLVQNEIPLSSTLSYLSLAHSEGVSTVFNPSPMPTPAELRAFPWTHVSWLLLNEGEAADLLTALGAPHVTPFEETKEGLPSTPSLLTSYSVVARLSRHPAFSRSVNIVCTLGSAGVLALLPALLNPIYVPAAKLEGSVRDTTGAGDCFTGYLVAELMRQKLATGVELHEAKMTEILRIAVQAAGICVERRGAMESIPTRAEVLERLQSESVEC